MRFLAAVLLVLGLTSVAAADIRIDKPGKGWPNRPVPRPSPRPATPPTTEAPRPAEPPPAESPRPDEPIKRGMGPEWLFGIAALALGLAGLSRYRPRRDATT